MEPDSFDTDLLAVTDRLTEFLRQHLGERCRDYEPECTCCRAWRCVVELLSALDRADLLPP